MMEVKFRHISSKERGSIGIASDSIYIRFESETFFDDFLEELIGSFNYTAWLSGRIYAFNFKEDKLDLTLKTDVEPFRVETREDLKFLFFLRYNLKDIDYIGPVGHSSYPSLRLSNRFKNQQIWLDFEPASSEYITVDIDDRISYINRSKDNKDFFDLIKNNFCLFSLVNGDLRVSITKPLLP